MAAFIDAVERSRARKIPVCAHVILGLPGESMEDMLDTARFLARHGVQAVKIHLLYVIRGTALAQMYRTGGIFVPFPRGLRRRRGRISCAAAPAHHYSETDGRPTPGRACIAAVGA